MEKEKDENLRVQPYKSAIKNGGDILLSDQAVEAFRENQEFMSVTSIKVNILPSKERQ